MTDASHQGLILDQFTRQATLFSTAAAITNADALRMIVEAARPGPDDTVLDVACGGGIVVCAFAPLSLMPAPPPPELPVGSWSVTSVLYSQATVLT